jgi:hypothetical protein
VTYAALVSERTDDDLDALLAQVPPGGSIPLRLEEDRAGRAVVRPDEGAVRALRALPGLASEVRRLRQQVAEMETRSKRQADRADGPAREAPPPETLDDLGSLLSAPFRVSSRAVSAAKTDPLAALAVQVAKATAEGASDKEKARLIAMAFAASEGDLDGFWDARRSRKAPGAPARAAAKKGRAS